MKGERPEFNSHRVRWLNPRVRRITAPNPGVMTGPGTNCYLVGRERVAVIDTGTDDPDHIRRLAEAGGGRIEWILVTHTHPDHSCGTRELQALTGAPILGHHIELQGVRDENFQADAYLDEGDVIKGADFCLRVLHTPGHAANHLCFLLEQDGLLFAGDHVMEGVTVVINPPDGNMRDYLTSLERLKREPICRIAPAHGHVLDQPGNELQRIIDHRLARERQILDMLADHGPLTISQLVGQIYADVPKQLHVMAARSVLAHLLKLADESRIVDCGTGRWTVALA